MIWPAFLLGIAGSLHCIGMCGPLALALPVPQGSRMDFVAGRLLYNAGRTLTYAIMGGLFGLIGQTFVLTGWQRGLSIASGIVMLLAIWGGHRIAPAWPMNRLKPAWSKLLQQRSRSALLGIGILNGLLPCGLVYVGLAGAAATGHASTGALFMAVFGLGTVPAMLTMSMGGRLLTPPVRQRIQRIIPYAATALAVLFILRGMSLGIPYVSPVLADDAHAACCGQ